MKSIPKALTLIVCHIKHLIITGDIGFIDLVAINQNQQHSLTLGDNRRCHVPLVLFSAESKEGLLSWW